MGNCHNLMTKLKLKIQQLKKFEIQSLLALQKTDSGKSYCEKTVQSKLGEIDNSIKNISWKLKILKKGKKLLKKELQVTQASYTNLQKDFNENEAFSKLNFAMLWTFFMILERRGKQHKRGKRFRYIFYKPIFNIPVHCHSCQASRICREADGFLSSPTGM